MSYVETLPGNPATWTAPDAWASEGEVGEFFYGLVRLLKPALVIETGCYHGHTCCSIGKALAENRYGTLISCDTNPEKITMAKRRWQKTYVSPGGNFSTRDLVRFVECSGEELCRETANVDLAFLDSSGDRVAEALALRLSPRGIVVLHDARRDTLNSIIEKTGWQSVFVDTPRGLAILQPKR